MEWKWTHGGSYVRSKRQYSSKNDDVNQDIKDAKFNKEIETSAYTTALNHDENTWDILNNIQSQGQSIEDFRQVNKREDTDKKLAERDLMCQATNWDREKKKEES